ncbi:hypothetical protein CDCA_CDCA09G2826 [Cyanidium caldarium]|uniref:Glycosyltransferase 2-like domain-containing protein n=1 Tax=Cyanidium caldarium TaxID=2771 RepID=A0AAV9IXI9_CYACA|nr:hypothetical protein CDCA_CDCA09G2826 [Cyanidium caldarium]
MIVDDGRFVRLPLAARFSLLLFLLLLGRRVCADAFTDDGYAFATRGEAEPAAWPHLPPWRVHEPIPDARAPISNDIPVDAPSVPPLRAYVTAIQDPHRDVVAACALAHSIRAVVHGVRRGQLPPSADVELVALVDAGALSPRDQQRLQRHGYRVMQVARRLPTSADSPYAASVLPAYLRVPLAAWSLTRYRAVIYLQPHSLALSPSLAELFHCGCFCAAVQRGEYFSVGIFGARPSAAIHAHMLHTLYRDVFGSGWHRHRTDHSAASASLYTEAGRSLDAFLNAYFRDLLRAPYFPLRVPAEHIDDADPEFGSMVRLFCHEPALLGSCVHADRDGTRACVRRLPIGYNGDPVFHGVFSNTRAIRFEWPFLPYAWWSGWYVGNRAAWRAVLEARRVALTVAPVPGRWPLHWLADDHGVSGGLMLWAAGWLLVAALGADRTRRTPARYAVRVAQRQRRWRLLAARIAAAWPVWTSTALRSPIGRRSTRPSSEMWGSDRVIPEYLLQGAAVWFAATTAAVSPLVGGWMVPRYLPGRTGVPLFALFTAHTYCTLRRVGIAVLVSLHGGIESSDTATWRTARTPDTRRVPRIRPTETTARQRHRWHLAPRLRALWRQIVPPLRKGGGLTWAHLLLPPPAERRLFMLLVCWWLIAPALPILITRNVVAASAIAITLVLLYVLSSCAIWAMSLSLTVARFSHSSHHVAVVVVDDDDDGDVLTPDRVTRIA